MEIIEINNIMINVNKINNENVIIIKNIKFDEYDFNFDIVDIVILLTANKNIFVF